MQSRIHEMNAMTEQAEFIAASRDRDAEPSNVEILDLWKAHHMTLNKSTYFDVLAFARAVLALRR